MSIRSGIDDKYDINVFNSDAWKIAYEYVTKQYVDDNFAGLYSSNLFRGFNFFQNGLIWQAGSLQNDGSILLVDTSGNSITINKTKFDVIDASLNDLTLNKASKQDITDAINNLVDNSPEALNTLKEISTALNDDPSFANTIINQVALKAPINNPTFTGTVSGITKAMVGLSAVNNTSDANKPVSVATQNALNLKANILNPTFSGYVSGITKEMVDLSNVDNTSDISKPISVATQNALNTKADLLNPSFSGYVSGITKEMVGLGNVDNTSDINKAISSATQNALNTKADLLNPSFSGTVSGITKEMVGLGNVDNTSDINKAISFATQNALDLKANSFNPTFTGTVSGITKSMVGLSNVNNTTDANKPVSTATQNALNLKANSLNPTFTGTVSGITKAMVGLENADNIADINKPVSIATQNALNLKADDNVVVKLSGDQSISGIKTFTQPIYQNNLLLQGYDNGYAYIRPVNENSVLFLGAHNTNTIAITQSATNIYGTTNVENLNIFNSVSGISKAMVGLENVDNVSDINKPVSIATQNALDLKANILNPTFTNNITVINDITADDIYTKGVNLYNHVQPLNNSRFHTLTYSATPLSNSSEGLAQVSAYTFTIPARCSDKITLTIPIAFHRDFRINGLYNTLSITEHITAQANLTKNGVLFAQSASNLLESFRSVYIINQKKTSTVYSYDLYAGNIYFEFIPTYEMVATTYVLNLTHNAVFSSNEPNSQTFLADYIVSNTSITNFFSSVNTDIATIVSSPSPNLSYTHVPASSSIESVKTLSNITNEYTEFNNPVFVNQDLNTFDINSNGTIQSTGLNVSGNITAEQMTITGNARVFGAVTMNNGLAGYHIDGTANFLSTPVFCSMKSFGRANTDNYWYLNAGFKIELYNSNDYVSWIKTLDNTNGTTGVLYTLNDLTERDRTESFKIFYLNAEIYIPPLS